MELLGGLKGETGGAAAFALIQQFTNVIKGGEQKATDEADLKYETNGKHYK